MAQIYEYMDYRQYLHDFFAEKKQALHFYSYRLFSQKAGFRSPNFLQLVIKGKRNLSKESVYKFSKALGLNRKETDYFENLIFFNQSKTLDEKRVYLEKIMKYRAQCDPRKIEEAEYDYYSHWYNPVVRELVAAIDFRGDFNRLGAAMVPAITGAEAAKAVDLLLKLNFIERREDGTFSKTVPSLTTGPHVRSVAVAQYHRSMLQLASDSLERFEPGERDITSLTLSLSEETRKAMIERLQQFRRELIDMAEQDERTGRVVQVNFQIFPLSRPYEGRENTP